MTGDKQRQKDRRELAADFVVGPEPPSRDDDERLLEWMSDSPENVREYLMTSAIWEALAEPGLIHLGSPAEPHRWTWWPKRVAVLALAASLAVAVGWIALRARESVTHSTDVGEVASFQLEDRSVVFMNADSELVLDYSKKTRRVILRSGEASFEVAKDPQRPFVVESGATHVIAVGTEFVVRRDPARTTVTVLEGRVVVEGDFDLPLTGEVPAAASETLPGRREVPLGPKQRLAVEDSRRVSLTTVETREAISWRHRRLVFDAERLEEVAAEFNRFNTKALSIEDESLAELRISGVFEANDPESLLAFLRTAEGAVVEVGTDGVTIVRRAEETSR